MCGLDSTPIFFRAGSVKPAPTPGPAPTPAPIPDPDPEDQEDETPGEIPDISGNVIWYDGAGNKYVLDGETNIVTVYDSEGNVIGTFQQ